MVKICYHCRVIGRVQGVFFRQSAQEVAQKLGIQGWVRNTDSGDVELEACGESQSMEAFLAWLKSGPPRAQVERLEKKEVAPIQHSDFEIRR